MKVTFTRTFTYDSDHGGGTPVTPSCSPNGRSPSATLPYTTPTTTRTDNQAAPRAAAECVRVGARLVDYAKLMWAARGSAPKRPEPRRPQSIRSTSARSLTCNTQHRTSRDSNMNLHGNRTCTRSRLCSAAQRAPPSRCARCACVPNLVVVRHGLSLALEVVFELGADLGRRTVSVRNKRIHAGRCADPANTTVRRQISGGLS